MQPQETRESQFSSGLLAGAAAAILLLGGAGGFWAWNILSGRRAIDPVDPSIPSTPALPPGSPSGPVAQAKEMQIYGLDPTETGFELVARAMPLESGVTAGEAISEALTALLQNDVDSTQIVSTIPADTKLLGVSVEDDGSIRVNLSSQFASGGGSTSVIGRVAQVLYTATSLDPEAAVYFEMDGKPLEYLGGEGLELSQPMTRAEFRTEFEF